MFNFTLPITRDNILKKVSEEDIFERYLGIRPNYSKQFCNPLREDHHPTCSFYIDSRNRIKFIDPARGFNWDCFNIVEYLEKVSFKEAMKIVAVDFGIIDGQIKSNPTVTRVVRQKEKTYIRIKRRDWNKEDKEYWYDRYYQTRADLQFLSIFPVSHAWYERVGSPLELFYYYKVGDPCYAYHFGDYDYKLYFPKRDKGKRFKQTRGDILQGYNQLPPKMHILVIIKAMKDVACFNKIGKEFDAWGTAPMSETQLIPVSIMSELKERADYIFTFFDFDRAGIKLMRKYEAEYDIPWIMLGKKYKDQGIKDFADLLHIKRWDITRQLFIEQYNERIG